MAAADECGQTQGIGPSIMHSLKLLAAAACSLILSGCAAEYPLLKMVQTVNLGGQTISKSSSGGSAFKPPSSMAGDRQLQSRLFAAEDEAQLILAGISVLQDSGFTINETEKTIGLATAVKTLDPQEVAEANTEDGDRDLAALLTSLATVAMVGILADVLGLDDDDDDKTESSLEPEDAEVISHEIRVNYVTRPAPQKEGEFLARVTFQRILTDADGVQYAEILRDPSLYTSFFGKLSKAVFLDAHQL